MQSNTNFNNKTILITGGAGFIGSNLALYFQAHFPKSHVVIFDCFRNEEVLSNGNLKSFGHYDNLINFDGDVICGDITNLNDLKVLNNYKFDFIFHEAAISDTRIYDQELIMRTNVNSFYYILELGRKNNAVIVYASSAATYGDSPSPQTIGNENPQNPYGYSKYLMDKIAMKYSQNNSHMIISGLRYFNVFGPGEFYKNKTASMVIQLGHQILDEKPPRLFKNSNNIFRDFIYIDDVVQANIKACQPKYNGIFNIGTGISRSFQEVADILQKELGYNLGTEYFENPHSGYQTHTKANIDRLEESLGLTIEFSLEAGIKAYIPEIKKLHNTK